MVILKRIHIFAVGAGKGGCNPGKLNVPDPGGRIFIVWFMVEKKDLSGVKGQPETGKEDENGWYSLSEASLMAFLGIMAVGFCYLVYLMIF